MGNFLILHRNRLIFCVIYTIVIVSIYNFVNASWQSVIGYCNGLFISGFSLVCFGCLSIINRFGGFEIFSYLFARKNTATGKEDLYTYSTRKRDERYKKGKVYLPYFIIGGIILLISMILMIWA